MSEHILSSGLLKDPFHQHFPWQILRFRCKESNHGIRGLGTAVINTWNDIFRREKLHKLP